MFKEHPLIATLSTAGAVALGVIALSEYFRVEPLRDVINSQGDRLQTQESLIEKQNAEIAHLRNQLSPTQQQVPPSISREKSGLPPESQDPVPADKNNPDAPSSVRILQQLYEGFSFELVNTNAVGTSITFTFNITNTNPQDKKLMIAGSDRGNNRFLGYYSSLLAGGTQYIAERSSIAGDRSVLIIPAGQTVRATVRFDGIPVNLSTIEHLTLRVSTEDSYPSYRLPFGPIDLSR